MSGTCCSNGEANEEESSGSACETVVGGAPSPEGSDTTQWALPIIPCACSLQLPEDAPMTRQGLMNRSLPIPDTTCDECLQQAQQLEDNVPSTSNVAHHSDIVNSDDNVNYKQNVSLSGECGLRTMDEWKEKRQSSDDLHVHYSENWEALCSSGQVRDDCDKR